MPKILEIHEVHDWMLELDLSEFDILTFDDGLYSQYKHFKHFLKFDGPKYFFISTDIVCTDEKLQNKELISCRDAHKNYRVGDDKSAYMTWDQIKEISEYTNCFIGGHSHTHPKLEGTRLVDQMHTAMFETKIMIKNFKQNDIIINSFCYPYNYPAPGYKLLLNKKYNVNEIFGDGRTSIEELKGQL